MGCAKRIQLERCALVFDERVEDAGVVEQRVREMHLVEARGGDVLEDGVQAVPEAFDRVALASGRELLAGDRLAAQVAHDARVQVYASALHALHLGAEGGLVAAEHERYLVAPPLLQRDARRQRHRVREDRRHRDALPEHARQQGAQLEAECMAGGGRGGGRGLLRRR